MNKQLPKILELKKNMFQIKVTKDKVIFQFKYKKDDELYTPKYEFSVTDRQKVNMLLDLMSLKYRVLKIGTMELKQYKDDIYKVQLPVGKLTVSIDKDTREEVKVLVRTAMNRKKLKQVKRKSVKI